MIKICLPETYPLEEVRLSGVPFVITRKPIEVDESSLPEHVISGLERRGFIVRAVEVGKSGAHSKRKLKEV
jgi:hypothetical protein